MITMATCVLAAIVGTFPPPLQATNEKPEKERPKARFTSGLLVEFVAGLAGSGLSVTRGDIGIDAPLPPLGSWRLGADLASEWSWYDFDDFPSASGGLRAPLAHAQSSLLGLTIARPFGDAWIFVGRPVVAFSGDQEAEFADSVLFGGFVTLGRQITPELSLSAGVYAAGQFEDDAVVFPIVGIEWQMDADTRLHSRGPGLRLTRRLDPSWQGFLQGTYRPRDYRLADGSSVPGGALSDDSFPVVFGVDWTPRTALQVTFQVGALLGRSVELRDDSGATVFDEQADASAFVGLGLRVGL